MRRTLALLALLGTLAACEPKTPTYQAAEQKVTIAWQVTNVKTQQPIPNAHLDLVVNAIQDGNHTPTCAEGPDAKGITDSPHLCPWTGIRIAPYRHTITYRFGVPGAINGTAKYTGHTGEQLECWLEREGTRIPDSGETVKVTRIDPISRTGKVFSVCLLALTR